MQEYQGVWVRFAGNIRHIKEGRPHHWRCFVNAQGEEMPLTSWRLVGEATTQNFRVGTDPEAKNLLGLFSAILLLYSR